MNEKLGQELEDIKQFKEEKLDKVGCGFCLAKWQQVSIYLQNGTTHSCHYPMVHKIPLEEVKKNPSALHNTSFKKLQRKKMLNNERPSECQYCWNVEDLNSDALSERAFKSHNIAPENYDKVLKCGSENNYNPEYIEVSFSHICNFKCTYCNAGSSSLWEKEDKKYNEYYVDENKRPYSPLEKNPYIEAWWKWFPTIYKNLKVLRITGGEPLLSKDTFKTLDYIMENSNTNLELSINSNLQPNNEKLWNKFSYYLNEMKNCVKSITLYVSIDGYEKDAEYMRTGLVHEKFWSNMYYILDNYPHVKISIMSTFNVFSIPSYMKLLKECLEIKYKYNYESDWRLYFDVSYLRMPHQQSVFVLPYEYSKSKIQEMIDFMKTNSQEVLGNRGFYKVEIHKFERILELIKQAEKRVPENSNEKNELKKSFLENYKRLDYRRNTDHYKTFTELQPFFKECEKIKYEEI